MISWIQLWPVLVIPYVVLFSVGVLPTIALYGHAIGGSQVREWLLNHVAIPLLPNSAAWSLVDWFGTAGTAQEIGLHAVLSLNVYAIAFPLFYLMGVAMIRLSAWSASLDLKQKRQSLKR
ncbi:MAG: hypothetical protein FD165_2668 [Gammaproteobacteria bacterium]|nr:MAG: hypothetical protein FD165_2668 [Gammaproteobacteria bacterium]TND01141.1 MAG: hypothetical protein FD120_2677 [Gammaproteobacteria bacterium]